jgi:FHS family L-fucose permease-like MFS transporter
LVQNWIADISTYQASYLVIIAGLAYMLWYALIGCKNVNKDIPVE